MLAQELNDNKEKILKLTKEKNQWEKERGFLIAKIDVLNENQLILEKEKEDKNKKKEVQIVHPTTETNIESIVQAMSQMSLRDT